MSHIRPVILSISLNKIVVHKQFEEGKCLTRALYTKCPPAHGQLMTLHKVQHMGAMLHVYVSFRVAMAGAFVLKGNSENVAQVFGAF